MKSKTLDELTGREVYDQVTAYLEREAKKAESNKKPTPSPMNFQLSTQEEQDAEIAAIESHNRMWDSIASTYRDVAYVMEYSYVTKIQREQDIEDLNKFGAGI